MAPNPLLTAVSWELCLDPELWWTEDEREVFDRVKVCGWFDYPTTESISSEVLRKEPDVTSIMHKYYSTVEKVYLRPQRKGYQPDLAYPVPPGLVRYQYRLLFEVFGARPNEPEPA